MHGKNSDVLISARSHSILRVIAGKGILSSAILTGVMGFITTILFLFCTPSLDVLFSLEAPQPFVQLYALALGQKASIFMTIIAVIGLILVTIHMAIQIENSRCSIVFQNTTIAVVASSRLVFAVARDGVLPMSSWIGQVDGSGQPMHAVTVILLFSGTILCTILPSQVAFTSLVSAGGVPTIAAYGLIALLRLTMTPNSFQSSYFFLGRFRKLFYFVTVLFNGLIVAVRLSIFLSLSPGSLLNPSLGHDISFLLPCYRCDFQLCQSDFNPIFF